MVPGLLILIIPLIVLLVISLKSFGINREYQRAVLFRLGRLGEMKGPGWYWLIPFVDRVVKVNMQIVTMSVPAQDGITRDNVSVRVDAVVYFRVVDPVKAVVNVQNYLLAVSQVASARATSTTC